MQKLIIFIICLLTIALAFTSCSSEENDLPPENNNKFTMEVNVGDVQETRALIDTETLKSLCSPDGEPDVLTDQTERVGIWVDLRSKENSTIQEGYLRHNMAYFEKPGGRKGKHWNYYPVEDQYWTANTYMICRTFFPSRFLNDNNMIPSSDASNFYINYSSVAHQKDILIGYNYVDSDTKESLNRLPEETDLNVIPIKMQHALAALQFKFVLSDDNISEQEKITSCWLEGGTNQNAQNKFGTVGQMKTGVSKDFKSSYISWTKTFFPESRLTNYLWVGKKDQNGKVPGLPFGKGTKEAVLYKAETTEDNNKYAVNDGYILIIPQVVPEDLNLCFTLKSSGATISRVKINTGGHNIGSVLNWLPSYKYSYKIIIGNAGINVEVTNTPWNNLDSNHGVYF